MLHAFNSKIEAALSTAPAGAPILLAGPTASGKSALALELAGATGGAIVNADSMQVYRELSILTACPTADDRARAPHRLFGHVSAAEAYSVGRWLEDLTRALAELKVAQRRPIIVGGTGLYFRAMLEGLSPVPAIPPEIRADWRARAETLGAVVLHRELARRDAVMAARLRPSDTQRVTRALEVLEATGRSLATWQAETSPPLIHPARAVRLVVVCEGHRLRRRAEDRVDAMVAAGAVEEVRALMAMGLSQDLPVMRALGVRPLAEHLAGHVSLDAAIAATKAETWQYIRRQQTWIRRNMNSWLDVETQ
jgi:tRNA dimethylallyltransferase